MKILVIGGNGREHSIIWKLSQSEKISKIYASPGNAGISALAECVPIDSSDINGLKNFVKKNKIDLTVVGPEIPLSHGVVDIFEREGLDIFGPNQLSSKLESSKIVAKRVMKSLNIPTADFMMFDDHRCAKQFVNFMDQSLVIKTDGLAGGKGVFMCENKDDACKAIDKIMVDKIFGSAGNNIVIERKLEGSELTFLSFIDGKHIATMPITRDYKRALNSDEGENTGGMGAYGPVHVNEALHDEIIDTIVAPLMVGLSGMGTTYKGVLYVGLMIDKNNKPKVLEFNVRFGDPEAQVLMSLLKTDLIDIIQAINNQTLNELSIEWRDESSVCVVLASQGYPNKYETEKEIFGLDKEYENINVFHSGTKLDDSGKIVTNGGRVLSVTSTGKNLTEAKNTVYSCIGKNEINFDGFHFRKDIGDI